MQTLIDSDDSIRDPDYDMSSNESTSSDDNDKSPNPVFKENGEEMGNIDIVAKKGKKRQKNMENWISVRNKKLRNTGQPYTSYKTKKLVRGREIKRPCSEKCRTRCWEKFTEEERKIIFDTYWKMGNLQRQRDFIVGSMKKVEPKYRYVRGENSRLANNAFYFQKDGQYLKVCKLFFMNTLDINHRIIRTVIKKKAELPSNILTEDLRGKHNNHAHVEEAIKDKMRQHISSIPKIPSHYCRADTTREYIDGSKNVSQIYRDYVYDCQRNNETHGNYVMFHRIFTKEFNLGFYTPKKDQCEQCVAYQNASNGEKDERKEAYDQHLVEKELARQEKKKDKEVTGGTTFVLCYDLQAVFQCPKGDISVFYYKSKLNVFNLTFFDLKSTDVYCFVWHEGEADRGVNEIGSCVLKVIEEKALSAKEEPIDLIFYTDNCGGQQKNKFMIKLYQYAVQNFPKINSITHKFLVKGHTQNEGDCAHSLIEREVKRSLKAAPIYTPEHFVTIIRSAKKTGRPYKVFEMTHEDFFDIKNLPGCPETGCLKNKLKEVVKISKIAVLKVTKEQPSSFFYKTSYSDVNFKEVETQKPKQRLRGSTGSSVTLKPAYKSKRKLPEKKKQDLMDLIKRNHIPKFYSSFFNSL